jgi:hypothetical protein
MRFAVLARDYDPTIAPETRNRESHAHPGT